MAAKHNDEFILSIIVLALFLVFSLAEYIFPPALQYIKYPIISVLFLLQLYLIARTLRVQKVEAAAERQNQENTNGHSS